MKLLLTVSLFFLFSKTHSQIIAINGEHGNRPLAWSDFTGKVDKSSDFSAYTAYSIGYRFSGVSFSGDTAKLQGFELKLDFTSNKSWTKPDKQTPELLKHEQGHFDLGRLTVAEMMNTINNTVFFKNDFQQKLRTIVADIRKKYHDLGVRYDQETNHSKNKTQQEKWNAWIAAETTRLVK